MNIVRSVHLYKYTCEVLILYLSISIFYLILCCYSTTIGTFAQVKDRLLPPETDQIHAISRLESDCATAITAEHYRGLRGGQIQGDFHSLKWSRNGLYIVDQQSLWKLTWIVSDAQERSATASWRLTTIVTGVINVWHRYFNLSISKFELSIIAMTKSAQL